MVHTGYIPSVVEWKVAYMTKFRVPWFPETKASLWHRLWYHGSLDPALYVPAIPAPWVKGLFGAHRLHTLCCGMNSGVYGQVWGALVPKRRRRPSGRFWFYGSQTLHCMCQQYRLPRSKGYLVHTGYKPSGVEWIVAFMAKFGVPWFSETKASLGRIINLRQSGPCTVCTSNIGSLGQRAICYTQVAHPLLWNK